MTETANSPHAVRFGVFEADLRAGELRRKGRKLKLQEQPFQVLALLLERPGEVVTREALREKLWPADTFVEFDHSLNTAISKIREALGDLADNPRFVETLPRRGYRFIAPVEVPPPPETEDTPTPRVHLRLVFTATLALTALLAVLLGLNVGGLRERLLGGVAAGQIRSLAVLPLENLSGDPAQEYFADGMTEALITELGKISALRVISRQSVMQFKGTDKTLPDIAHELNVDVLVEGSVRRVGDRVRISAQLMQATPERLLWAESFERDLSDVLALESEVARAIAHEVKVTLTPQEEALLATKHVINPEAHLAYLKGRHHFWKATCEGPRRSIEFYQEALNLDPAYAPGHAGMADAYNMLAAVGCLEPKEAYPLAKVAARRALELDNTLAEAHISLASIRENYEWDWLGAEREYQRAIELNPGYATAHTWYASFLSNMGRHEQAIAEIRRAQALDPLSLAVNTVLGGILNNARQYDQAIEKLQETLELHPGINWPHVELGRTYVQKAMYEEAIQEFQEAVDLSEGEPVWELGYAYAVAGNRGEAQKVLEELKKLSKWRYVSPYGIALIYAGLGEKDQAFEWLEKAYEERDPNMVWLKNDAWLDPLRFDPRFHSLLRRLNFLE